MTFLEDERVFLVRKGNTFRCLSAVCTHLGCTVNRAEQGYHCPCHGSVFDDAGLRQGRPGAAGTGVVRRDDEQGQPAASWTRACRVAADKYLVLP